MNEQVILTQRQLEELANMIAIRVAINTKDILTSDEAAIYMGISKSYLYKLTMRREIPHYKPMGKMCYFNRAELLDWLQMNRVSTTTEIAGMAMEYTMKKI